MITRDIAAFTSYARTLAPDFGPATARAAFLVAPDGFRLAEQSAADNRYMADAARFDAAKASAEHRALQRALAQVLPTVCFAGDPDTPDALFPNNVLGVARGKQPKAQRAPSGICSFVPVACRRTSALLRRPSVAIALKFRR